MEQTTIHEACNVINFAAVERAAASQCDISWCEADWLMVVLGFREVCRNPDCETCGDTTTH